ncbi:xanthine dehydrogenase family protein molybdopterin-binding subunit [Mangrovicoccus algicola]|uniref:Xanthine dehydrogenase family protein molybdopterin-binding subunit n=1 Tax=Mangrovicoccus algicola TaxID=2771008 RepID=A0A8J7CK73_9RHOB|nr:xanthine dehydrogenase family protein molybdopterin-binding subunit [Mangrovicoccus algicola]MBE3638401.1 xanthine dehydrogenase family protein molybdopterin-binding subunit [Mangrovicoccus algicola]
MPDDIAPTRHQRLGSNAGDPHSRLDGIAKITGAARYAADNAPAGLLWAVIAGAPVARGRVARLDTAAALAHPGVTHVITPENRPALHKDPDLRAALFDWKLDLLQDDRIRYAGAPMALVLAETAEAAAEGARLLAPEIEADPARIGFGDGLAFAAETVGIGAPPATAVGDVEAGFAAAAQVTEVEIETPPQYHNAMEPHAIVAQWQGERLVIDTPNQAIVMSRPSFAAYFGIPPENVHIRSPYLGGGFGSKAILNPAQILACLAARETGRPVKLVLSRAQMYGPTGHRGATRQSLRLGVDAAGRLTALSHHAVSATSSFDDFLEPAANAALNTYACPAISVSHSGSRWDIGTPGPMRAPGEATGSAALECAMDEAAHAAGLDPLDFRLRNYAETDPATGRAYSSKALRECYALGAERFGWKTRPMQPGQMRDARGRLLGWGMGTSLFPAPMFQAEARATLRADGSAVVETAASDMGQGAWTALAQIAAEGLGLDLAQVEFRSGDSELPDAGVAGGSGHTATAGSALYSAGRDVIAQLTALATADPASPLHGAGNRAVVAADGWLRIEGEDHRRESYAAILARAGRDALTGRGKGARDPAHAEARAMFSHGAVFAEVAVDPALLQIRVTRLTGAFAAGRIINPKLAESQLLGGMIWGLGFALQEEALHDRRSGRLLNADLAGYHVPVNADLAEIEALTVHEEDRFVNPLGVKGVGELGITGTAGAIANAVWHATGRRVRRFPIHPEDLA